MLCGKPKMNMARFVFSTLLSFILHSTKGAIGCLQRRTLTWQTFVSGYLQHMIIMALGALIALRYDQYIHIAAYLASLFHVHV